MSSSPTSKQRLRKAVLDAVPANWLDPLLTGKDSAVKYLPADGHQIEALLRGIRIRIQGVFDAHEKTSKRKAK